METKIRLNIRNDYSEKTVKQKIREKLEKKFFQQKKLEIRNAMILIPFRFCFSLIPDKIMATLGEGTFGRVVKVKDMQM